MAKVENENPFESGQKHEKHFKYCKLKFISTLADAWRCQGIIHSWTFSANKLIYVMYFSMSLQQVVKIIVKTELE